MNIFRFYIIAILITTTACRKYTESFTPDELSADISLSEHKNFIEIEPMGNSSDTAILFYPGAKVAPMAYVQMLSGLAESGYSVVIVDMPMDLAVLAPEKGLRIIDEFPDITTWVISGHSLGGAMACTAVYKNTDTFTSLILMAAYPPKSKSLKDEAINVLSISASEDGLTLPEDIEESKKNLPDNTQFSEIEGGNHAGFGSYGAQKSDGKATITTDEQHKIITTLIIDFLQTKQPAR